MHLRVSSRNQIEGTITRVETGTVNTVVTLAAPGGDALVAVVTQASARSLDLAVGKPAVALIKASSVIVQAGRPTLRCSARNQLAGTVASVQTGAVNSEVGLQLPGGLTIFAVITNDAVTDLALKPGVAATALVKASHVVLGVPA